MSKEHKKKKQENMVSESLDAVPRTSLLDRMKNLGSKKPGKAKKPSRNQPPHQEVADTSSDGVVVQEEIKTNIKCQSQYCTDPVIKPCEESVAIAENNQTLGTDFSSQNNMVEKELCSTDPRDDIEEHRKQNMANEKKSKMNNQASNPLKNDDVEEVNQLSENAAHRSNLLSTREVSRFQKLVIEKGTCDASPCRVPSQPTSKRNTQPYDLSSARYENNVIASPSKESLAASDISSILPITEITEGVSESIYNRELATVKDSNIQNPSPSDPICLNNSPYGSKNLDHYKESGIPINFKSLTGGLAGAMPNLSSQDLESAEVKDNQVGDRKVQIVSTEELSLLISSQSEPRHLDCFKESKKSSGFMLDCPNQSTSVLCDESQSHVADVCNEGISFAKKLECLPEDSLEEAEKKVLETLFQIEKNIHQSQSVNTSELPSLSTLINMSQLDDPFIAKGMYIAKKLASLPEEKKAEVKRSILYILYLFETGTCKGKYKDRSGKRDVHQTSPGTSRDSIAPPLRHGGRNPNSDVVTNGNHVDPNTTNQLVENSEGENSGISYSGYVLRRRPIDRMSESREPQNRISASNHNQPKNMGAKPAESLYHSQAQQATATASFKSNTELYPTSQLNELSSNSIRQETMDPNKTGHDSSSYEEEEGDSVISLSQPKTSPTVRQRPYIPEGRKIPQASCNATPKKSKSFKTTNSGSGYTSLYAAIGALVTVIVTVLGAVLYYQNRLNSFQTPSFPFPNFSPKASLSSPPQLDVVKIMDELKQDFGEQPPMTFKIVKSAIQTLNKANPKEPAIIALLAENGAGDIAYRFARRLAEAVSPDAEVVAISGGAFGERDPDSAKKAIDDMISGGLKENTLGALFVNRLDRIPGNAALIFHTYCDHENAPFKRVLIVMTVETEEKQLALVEPKAWDTKYQEHLYKSWEDMGIDQISSLMSRLTVRVAAIVPKIEG